MIRIAHISDSHFDERGRLDDVADVHLAFVDQAAAADVDLIVHSGDWFERRSTPKERLAVAEFLGMAMEIAPVFGVKGNHDADQDLAIFPHLDNRIEITDRPGLKEICILNPDPLGPSVEIGLLALPWFDKSHIVAGLDASADQAETREKTIAAAQNILDSLRHEATRLRDEGVIPILVAHVLVGGSEVSTGQTLIGTTVELSPASLLEVGAAYTACGHVHKTQTWFDGRVAYAGSPHRCNFGEPEAKGWRLVTLSDEGEFISNEFQELPARENVLIECDWSTEGGAAKLREVGINGMAAVLAAGRMDVAGALVRFRYRINPADRHLISHEAIANGFRDAGAAEVQVEAVIVDEVRARVAEIVETESIADKLDLFLDAKGIEVDETQRARLRDKLGVLERDE